MTSASCWGDLGSPRRDPGLPDARSASLRFMVGTTQIQCWFHPPVMCALAPRRKTPCSLRPETWRNRSGSACWCGGLPRSPFGSVMPTAMRMLWRCASAEEAQVAAVVLRAVLGVDVVRGRVQHADRVQARAPLEAGAGELPEAALHRVLVHEVLRRLGDVQEPVDPRVDDRRVRGGQFGLVDRQVVRRLQRVDRRLDDRVGGVNAQTAQPAASSPHPQGRSPGLLPPGAGGVQQLRFGPPPRIARPDRNPAPPAATRQRYGGQVP